MQKEPKDNPLNMRVLKKSRKEARAGDIFVYQMPDDLFRYGRVIRTDSRIGSFDEVLMLYFYRVTSASKLLVPQLDKNHLLIPPQGTNRLGWVRGYFETIENRALRTVDVLPVHCFWSPSFKTYRDEYGNSLPERVEPCGDYLLTSYRGIDDMISSALGILRAPVQPSQFHGKHRLFFEKRLAELQAEGVPPAKAKTQALKEAVRHNHMNPDHFAWPEPGEVERGAS